MECCFRLGWPSGGSGLALRGRFVFRQGRTTAFCSIGAVTGLADIQTDTTVFQF